jgi:hypothetical protein
MVWAPQGAGNCWKRLCTNATPFHLVGLVAAAAEAACSHESVATVSAGLWAPVFVTLGGQLLFCSGPNPLALLPVQMRPAGHPSFRATPGGQGLLR